MITIAAVLLVAAVASGVATRLRLPASAFLIASGIALSASGAPVDPIRVRELMLLAGSFLIFALGSELDVAHPRRHLGASLAIALGQIALLVSVALLVAPSVGVPSIEALHVALAVGASSTLVATDLLRRRQRFFEPVGRVAVGVLLVQDVVVIGGVAILASLGQDAEALARSVAALLALGLASVVARRLAPFAFARLGLDAEQQLLVVLATLFGFLGAAHALELPAPVGAFFAGVAFSRFPVSGIVRAKVSSFSDFFVAAFFVALGAAVTLPAWSALVIEGTLVATLVLIAPLALYPVARVAGLGTRTALEAITLLGQCGELALVVGFVGLTRGDLSERSFGVIATVAVVTMTLAPMLSSDRVVGWISRRLPRVRARPAAAVSRAGHVLWIGAGPSSRAALHALEIPVTVIEEDRDLARALAQAGLDVVHGDATHPETLAKAGLADARLVVSTLRRLADVERVVRAAGDTPVWIRARSEVEARAARDRGAKVVLESEAALERFLAWHESR